MIAIKTNEELNCMKKACYIAALALQKAKKIIKVGITTSHINKVIHEFIISKKAIPSFLNYGGFPASVCISINNEVIHGIPSLNRKIKDGDIVSIDVGAYYLGFHGDNAATYPVGNIDKRAEALIEATEKSLYLGINAATEGARIGDISSAIQNYIESNGYSIVKEFVGHGVGKNLHEEPEVPNYGKPNRGVRLVKGVTLAIEPMVNLGASDVRVLDDHWTVVTKDKSYSAHFEHTVVITKSGPQILTLC